MHDQRFDRLAKLAAARASRRRVLLGLVGIAAGELAALIDRQSLEAQSSPSIQPGGPGTANKTPTAGPTAAAVQPPDPGKTPVADPTQNCWNAAGVAQGPDKPPVPFLYLPFDFRAGGAAATDLGAVWTAQIDHSRPTYQQDGKLDTLGEHLTYRVHRNSSDPAGPLPGGTVAYLKDGSHLFFDASKTPKQITDATGSRIFGYESPSIEDYLFYDGHDGHDFGVSGDALATAAGTVTFSGDSGTPFGRVVEIMHPQGYLTRYAHLASLKVRKGDMIAQPGVPLGAIGGSAHPHGQSLQDNYWKVHLHFAAYRWNAGQGAWQLTDPFGWDPWKSPDQQKSDPLVACNGEISYSLWVGGWPRAYGDNSSPLTAAQPAPGRYLGGSLTDPRTEAPAPRIVSGPAVSDVTSTSVTISWVTDATANSSVDYDLTTDYGKSATSNAKRIHHHITLTGLTPGTIYHYRVRSKNESGEAVTKRDRSLTTSRDDGTVTLPQPYLGTWSGTGAQTNPDETWPVTLTLSGGAIGEVVGASAYPSLGCSGQLTFTGLTSTFPPIATLAESITTGQGTCVDGTFDIDGAVGTEGVSFRWTSAAGGSTASGTLTLGQQAQVCQPTPPCGNNCEGRITLDSACLCVANQTAMECGNTSCGSASDCQPDQSCVASGCADGQGRCRQTCATLTPPATRYPCPTATSECGPYVGTDTHNYCFCSTADDGGVCLFTYGTNDQCRHHASCAADADCKAGEACVFADWCMESLCFLTCEASGCVGIGASCSTDADCCAGLTCAQGTCAGAAFGRVVVIALQIGDAICAGSQAGVQFSVSTLPFQGDTICTFASSYALTITAGDGVTTAVTPDNHDLELPTGSYTISDDVSGASAQFDLSEQGVAIIASIPISTSGMGAMPQTFSVAVLAAQPWTDTGIDAAAGASIQLSASGLITIAGSDPGKTPDGDPSCLAGADWAAPGLPCWSLIGFVGTGAPFAVGSGTSAVADAAGRLWLGVNDQIGTFGDNAGTWTASVIVTQP